MSRLESSPALGWDRNVNHGNALVVGSFFLSGILAAGALVVTTGDGAQAARELVTRFSSLIFVSSLLVAPLARMFPARPLFVLAQMGENLRIAFVATYVFSLACILMPAAVAGEELPASSVFYIGINGLVLLVMLFPTNKFATRLLGVPAWRTIQLIASAYFWAAFMVSALVHIVRDSGAVVWYRLLLFLLVGTLGAIAASRFQNEIRP